MRPADDERDHLLLRAATLYYEQDLTQQEVAARLHLTRWQVGRLLAEARRSGVVRIEIHHPRARARSLEAELVRRTGLSDAVVVPSAGDEVHTRSVVAAAAGELLADLRPTPGTLAVSWGRTMTEVARQVPPSWASSTVVVQANGGLSQHGADGPGGVVAELARQARGTAVFLQAPAIVGSKTLAKTLMADSAVRRVLDRAKAADVLMFSLGPAAGTSVLVENGYIASDDVARLVEAGAVGDLVGHYITVEGELADPELDARNVGLTLDDVRASPMAIAVAAGMSKLPAALAAVSHGLCDVLVTDEDVATGLIEHIPRDGARSPAPGTE
jgi:deoxyribonucleoside regulator